MERQMKYVSMLAFAGLSMVSLAANRTNILENGDTVIVFDEAGRFSWTAPRDIPQARVLIVGGGGGGAGTGGGGGGQVVYKDSVSFEEGVSYSVSVGAAGASGAEWGNGGAGGETEFLGVVAAGGGGGGLNNPKTGLPGGNSGGSGAHAQSGPSANPTGRGGVDDSGWTWVGNHKGGCGALNVAGGGGGAVSDGMDGDTAATPKKSGDGGSGFPSDISGTVVYYACGGGGAADSVSGTPATKVSACGQGGSGANTTAGKGGETNGEQGGSAVPGTGSGGGGSFRRNSSGVVGGLGATGTVIIRYAAISPQVALSDFVGMADGQPHSIDVNVTFLPPGGRLSYARSPEGPWQPECPAYSAVGTYVVWVRVSAEGYEDFLDSAEVRILSEPETEGKVFFVVPEGTEGNVPQMPYTHWATAANSIQDALDQAKGVADSLVVVQSGVYPLRAMLAVSNTTVRSWVAGTGAVDRKAVVLDGQQMDSPVVELYGSVLCGLTIANAKAGVRVSGPVDKGHVRIDACVVSNMTAYGLSTADSVAPVVTNTLFACNKGPASTSNNGVPMFVGCVFSNNVSRSSKGMAINNNASITVDGCDFIGNGIDEVGGSTVWGSVISGSGSTYMTIRRSRFIGNILRQPSQGRGVLSFGGGGIVSGCVFSNNEWQVGSGSLKATFDRCAFYAEKGALMRADAGGSVSPKFRNSLFVTSVPADFSVGATVPSFENCTFATGGIGTFQKTWQGTGVSLANCLFAAGAAYNEGAGAQPLVFATNCCFAMETKLAGERDCFVSTRPRFVAKSCGNFRLKPHSPCRDRGVRLGWMTDATTDLDGLPRICDEKGVATMEGRPDIGCYECAAPYVRPGLAVFIR